MTQQHDITKDYKAAARRSATLCVPLHAPAEEVWDFVADPANLHLWTVDFAVAPPVKQGDLYKVTTVRGTLDLFVRGDRATGVVDFHFGRDGKFGCSPARVVPSGGGSGDGGGGCVFIFTQFEPDNAPPGLFEQLVSNVGKELEILAARFGAADGAQR